jgi:undecaprenyl diphosphate synthase
MNFNRTLLRQRRDELDERRVHIRRIGRRELVPPDVLEEFDEAERRTAHHTRMDLLTCFNYGGRAELEDSASALRESEGNGSIAEHLYAPDAPDVDLLIRTSGEMRLSNFLLWQSAYAELYFTETLWPDFDRHSLFEALRDYSKRKRRFGGL